MSSTNSVAGLSPPIFGQEPLGMPLLIPASEVDEPMMMTMIIITIVSRFPL